MQRQTVIRGDDARENFVRQNEITCVGHLYLQPGQSQLCCCGRKDITSEYFLFSCKAKQESDSEQTPYVITAGPGCGRKIAEKAGIRIPPIVSVFSGSNMVISGHSPGGVQKNEGDPFSFSPINKEMYEALSILFTSWGKVTPGYLSACFESIVQNPCQDVSLKQVIALNRALLRGINEKKLSPGIQSIVCYLAAKAEKTPRKFSFPRLKKLLEEAKFDEIIVF